MSAVISAPFKIMLREQANLPALYPQGKNVQCKFVVYFLFEGGEGGGLFLYPLLRRWSRELNITLLC